MSTLTSSIVNSALAVTVPLEALALIASIFAILLALVVAYVFLSFYYSRYQSAYGQYEDVLIIQGTNFFNNLSYSIRIYPSAVADMLFSLAELLQQNWINLLFIFLVAVIAAVWNHNDPAFSSAIARIKQCDVLPIIENIPFRLLNFLRSIYNAVSPLVSLGADWYHFATTGWYHILRECTLEEGDFESLLEQLGDATNAYANSIADFFQGDIFQDRWVTSAFWMEVGLIANAALEPLDCFCQWVHPVSQFVTSLAQVSALHEFLEAVPNIGIRLLQTILNALSNVNPPFWSDFFQEWITGVIALGETAEGAAILLYNLITDLINQIGLSAASDPTLTRQAFNLPMKYDDNGDVLAPSLSELMHAAGNTRASERLGTQLHPDLTMASGPIWDLPPGSNLSDILGLPALLILLQSPWSHIGTELIAAAIIVVNMTANVASNPFGVFDSPEMLAYFQVKPVFDRVRASWDAASQLLVIIDPNLPEAVSLAGQAIITYVEAVFELFFGTLTAVIFVTWTFGNPPPQDCSVPLSCSYPGPPGYTIFEIYVDYYDWDDNAIQRSLQLLEADADAIAVLLACNASTLSQDDCSELPMQCAIRTAFLLGAEAINQTNALIFYLRYTNLVF